MHGNSEIWKHGKPFKKGGTGRPKGAVSFKALVKKQVEREVVFRDVIDNKDKKQLFAEALVSRMSHLAMKGDFKAIMFFVETIDGKIGENININNHDVIAERKEKLKRLSSDERKKLMELTAKMNN